MKDSTDITLLLDRSGSMQSIRSDTISATNKFIEDQRKLPGDCALSLSQFDDRFDELYVAKPIKEAPLLTHETFVPRGWTRLLDAIGKLITSTGERFKAIPEADRPAKILFVIMTDGLENSSREYTQDQIASMIGHQRDVYKWNFIFLGANQDAILTAAAMNIPAAHTMTYGATAQGVANTGQIIGAKVRMYRASVGNDSSKLSFNKKDREDALK